MKAPVIIDEIGKVEQRVNGMCEHEAEQRDNSPEQLFLRCSNAFDSSFALG